MNNRQLKILIGLSFFDEFGNNKYLLNMEELFEKLGTRKTIKKDKINELGLNEYVLRRNSKKKH